MATIYCVVYRTGGTENFRWHRTLATLNQQQAIQLRANLLRAGYKALAPQDYKRSMAVGLPETYEP